MDKQNLIENEIDKHRGPLGDELVALIAVSARQVVNEWKPNPFIKDFCHSIGLKFKKDVLYVDVAVRIVGYLYPPNRAAWPTWDDIYMDQVERSAWLQQSC